MNWRGPHTAWKRPQRAIQALGHVYIGPANLGTIPTIVLHSYAKWLTSIFNDSVIEAEAEIPGLALTFMPLQEPPPVHCPLGTEACEHMGDQAGPRTRGLASRST